MQNIKSMLRPIQSTVDFHKNNSQVFIGIIQSSITFEVKNYTKNTKKIVIERIVLTITGSV